MSNTTVGGEESGLKERIWILSFSTKPEGIDSLPVGQGPGTKGEAKRKHYEQCFERLRTMIDPGVRITQELKGLGLAFITGDYQACLRLKDRVTKEKFAIMAEDAPMVLIE